jgi:hypothetical protein
MEFLLAKESLSNRQAAYPTMTCPYLVDSLPTPT